MTQDTERKEERAADGNGEGGESGRRGSKRVITIALDDFDDVERAARDAFDKGKEVAANVGDSIRDTIKSVKTTRDNVVMVRINAESLDKLDELVDSGVTNSRSAAAAFLIEEGVKARSDLFEKIAEQTEVIRTAKERLRRLLAEEGGGEGRGGIEKIS